MPGYATRRRRRRGTPVTPTPAGTGQLDFTRFAASGLLALLQEI